jgi:hypothetical protein
MCLTLCERLEQGKFYMRVRIIANVTVLSQLPAQKNVNAKTIRAMKIVIPDVMNLVKETENIMDLVKQLLCHVKKIERFKTTCSIAHAITNSRSDACSLKSLLLIHTVTHAP